MTREEIEGVVLRAIRELSEGVGVVASGRIAQRVADQLAHLTLDETERCDLKELRDSDCVTEDEAALLDRMLGVTP